MRLVTVASIAAVLIATAPASANAAVTKRPTGARSPGYVVRSCAESRDPRVMVCMALRRTAGSNVPDTAAAASKPGGFGPADLRAAYHVPGGGSGVTIAITDAYSDPHAASDLAVYREKFGLPACTTASGCLRIVNQNGARSPLPKPDKNWSGEISLDLDMVSAICPKCHILLVEAKSANDSDMLQAVSRAVAMGAKYVSNSWGSPESSRQKSMNGKLNHPGAVLAFSTGDDGYGAVWPASSQYVTAVGGTTLRRAKNARGWSETAWNDGGSGCSRFNAKPSWQHVTTGCGKRAEADVSAIADPYHGVAVYQTYGYTGWVVYGGTSAAAPIIATMYALAGKPGAHDYPASYPYAAASHFYDVTSGHNGGCGSRLCRAAAGWDGPTGLGTPNGVAGLRPSKAGTKSAADAS